MSSSFSRVASAATDGRLENVFWRQKELQSLYKALLQNSTPLQEAIYEDNRSSRTEAKIEYYRALHVLKRRYLELQPDALRKAEYRIANGEDAADARRPCGLVYIVPTTHTMFYSVVTTLAAAIAGGNCCILELENTPRTLPGVLGKISRQALDADIFDISTSKATLDSSKQSSLYYVQTGDARRTFSKDLLSNDDRRVIAVVDRTANVADAAISLVRSRFAFGGRSPYAPDLVLVNEFSKQEFLTVAAQTGVQLMAAKEHAGGQREMQDFVAMLQKEKGVRIVTSGSGGVILDATNSDAVALAKKLRLPCLVVEGISSLDRSFDIARKDGRLLAAYLFGRPEAVKYLSQFIDADVSFCNHVPSDLLLGPPAPYWTEDMTAEDRTPSSLFTLGSPCFIQPSASSRTIGEALETSSATALHEMEQEAREGWAEYKRTPVGGTVGFFEQGILVGLSMVLLTIGSSVALSVYGYRALRVRYI